MVLQNHTCLSNVAVKPILQCGFQELGPKFYKGGYLRPMIALGFFLAHILILIWEDKP